MCVIGGMPSVINKLFQDLKNYFSYMSPVLWPMKQNKCLENNQSWKVVLSVTTNMFGIHIQTDSV